MIGKKVLGIVTACAIGATIVTGCVIHNGKKIRKFNEEKNSNKKTKKSKK